MPAKTTGGTTRLVCDRCGRVVLRLHVCDNPTYAEIKQKGTTRIWICDDCKRKGQKK